MRDHWIMGLIKGSEIMLVPGRTGTCTTDSYIEITTERGRFTISPGQEFELSDPERLVIHREDSKESLPWTSIRSIRCEDPRNVSVHPHGEGNDEQGPRHLWFSFNSWIQRFSFSHKDTE